MKPCRVLFLPSGGTRVWAPTSFITPKSALASSDKPIQKTSSLIPIHKTSQFNAKRQWLTTKQDNLWPKCISSQFSSLDKTSIFFIETSHQIYHIAKHFFRKQSATFTIRKYHPKGHYLLYYTQHNPFHNNTCSITPDANMSCNITCHSTEFWEEENRLRTPHSNILLFGSRYNQWLVHVFHLYIVALQIW